MRTYPSIFQAWSGIVSPDLGETPEELIARHDLIWGGSTFNFAGRFSPIPVNVPATLAWRQRLLALNTEIKLLTEIRYFEATMAQMPTGKDWWWRKNGQLQSVWAEGNTYAVDYRLPEVHQIIMAQVKSAMDSGCFDGIMFDRWEDTDAHLHIIQDARTIVGDKLIICNCNQNIYPRTVPYMNGVFMEAGHLRSQEDWQKVEAALDYNEANVLSPKSNCLEAWYNTSPDDFNLMRAVTCLSLTHSDGYVLFAHPNELAEPDHRHSYYKFWHKTLGAPVSALIHERGLHIRKYEKGIAVYNPPGSGVSIYDSGINMKSVITQNIAPIHAVNSPGGGIFLYV